MQQILLGEECIALFFKFIYLFFNYCLDLKKIQFQFKNDYPHSIAHSCVVLQGDKFLIRRGTVFPQLGVCACVRACVHCISER